MFSLKMKVQFLKLGVANPGKRVIGRQDNRISLKQNPCFMNSKEEGAIRKT